MTPEQEARLRARILELRSLRQIYELIQDLRQHAQDVFSLPFFVLGAVLQDLAWRLEGIVVTPEVLAQIHQQLTPGMERVLNAYRRENREEMFAELNLLTKQWALLRDELL